MFSGIQFSAEPLWPLRWLPSVEKRKKRVNRETKDKEEDHGETISFGIAFFLASKKGERKRNNQMFKCSNVHSLKVFRNDQSNLPIANRQASQLCFSSLAFHDTSMPSWFQQCLSERASRSRKNEPSDIFEVLRVT